MWSTPAYDPDLNLVYLPLYAAGILGPLVGGAVSSVAGPTGPFWVGAAVFLVGAVVAFGAVSFFQVVAGLEFLLRR